MKNHSNNFTLVLNADTFTNENGDVYVGYGFTAYSSPPVREIFSIEDLSADENEVRELMRMIEDYDVSPVHFQDLVDDFCV